MVSSGSFQPPGQNLTGNLPVSLPISTTPSASTAPTTTPPSNFNTVLGQVTTPLANVLGASGQITQDNMTQVMHDIPNIMSGLSPDEQDKFLQLLMSSDILNAMFETIDNPKSKDSLNTVVNTLVDHGLFSQVAPDKAVLSEEAQGALKDALQQKLVQMMQQVSDSPKNAANTPQTTNQTVDPKLSSGTTTASSNIPQDPVVAQDAKNTLGTLNIPVAPPGNTTAMPENVASLVSNSLTSALQQFLGTGGTGTQTPSLAQAQAAPLLNALVALGITTNQGSNLQLVLPTKTDFSGQQTQLAKLDVQLTQLNANFTELGAVATRENWNIGPLQNFVTVPATLLTLLKTIQPEDTTTTNMLKTWVDNSSIVSNAILNRASDTYKDKFEFLKTVLLSSFTAAPAAIMKEQQVRQQMFEQVLMAAPALLNVFKLKDMVGVFEEDVKKKHAAILYVFKRMLFNAAHEITVVAAGKPTFEYNDVGIFHEQLEFLAQKISTMLPASADVLDFDNMELISNELTHTFEYIKNTEPRKVIDILKRHPRTTLYLLCIDSPVTADIVYPRSDTIGLTQDSTVLTAHFQRIMNLVKQYEKQSEFLKYQPKVFEAFIDEAKYNPTSEITKTSLDIIHKAVAECSGFIDLDSPD
ncbi:MAG: hypothetical protein LLF94_06540 [Chlamydiales bacterium]|nr:hypothetical protein [Chlamydiales bacterium]